MSNSDFGTEEVLEAPESQELKPVWSDAPRFCTMRDLPEYRFAPWNFPHPIREEIGYTKGEFEVDEKINPDRWKECVAYLFSIDLYHQGYLWEAREQLKGLHALAPKDSPESNLLQALYLNCSALIKAWRGDVRGLRKRSLAAHWRLSRIRAKGLAEGGRPFMGLDIADLIEQIRRYYSPVWELEDGEEICPEGDPPRLHPKNL